MHAREIDEDDWFTHRIDSLRPGWHGRVRITPDDCDSGAAEDIVGTIVGEADFERDEEDAIVDATVMLCMNYEGGQFHPITGQSRVPVRISQILDIEPF